MWGWRMDTGHEDGRQQGTEQPVSGSQIVGTSEPLYGCFRRNRTRRSPLIGLSLLVALPRKKMLNMRRFRARLKKRRFDGKCATKSTYAGTHAEAHIAKIKQAKRSNSAFSSFLFTSQNIIQYRNTNRNCKLAREPRKNQRASEAWAPQSRRKMYDEFRCFKNT